MRRRMCVACTYPTQGGVGVVVMASAGQRNKLTGKREGGGEGGFPYFLVHHIYDNTLHYITRFGTIRDKQGLPNMGPPHGYSDFPIFFPISARMRKEKQKRKFAIEGNYSGGDHRFHTHTYIQFLLCGTLPLQARSPAAYQHAHKEKKKGSRNQVSRFTWYTRKAATIVICLNGSLPRSQSHSSTPLSYRCNGHKNAFVWFCG